MCACTVWYYALEGVMEDMNCHARLDHALPRCVEASHLMTCHVISHAMSCCVLSCHVVCCHVCMLL